MNTIKRTAVMIVIAVFLSVTGICFAESDIPDMVGTWNVQSEGSVLLKGNDLGRKTHHAAGEFTTLKAEAVITKQQGRVLRGIFKSPKATENFVAVIGLDNKSFYYADEDGSAHGNFVGKDKVEVIYRHVTAIDTVIAVGTWTRKK